MLRLMRPGTLATLGDIVRLARARGLDVELHHVAYIIQTRDIANAGTAGAARVFDQEAIDTVLAELAKTRTPRPLASA